MPAGGGPPPHRHDFEEMSTVLDGEVAAFIAKSRAPAPGFKTERLPPPGAK